MGIIFAAATSGSDAPEFEDGIYPATFNGVSAESHPDWAGTGKYGKDDDGERLRWDYTLFDEGDPFPVNELTNLNFNTVSKTVPKPIQRLKALMTKGEYEAFLDGETPNSDELKGRRCQVQIEHNANGWPKIIAVLPAPKKKKLAVPVEDEEEGN